MGTKEYYCIARTYNLFVVLDTSNGNWCYVTKDVAKEVVINRDAIRRYKQYMIPMVVITSAKPSSVNSLGHRTNPRNIYGFKVYNSFVNYTEDMYVVPIETFRQDCGKFSDLLTFILLYGDTEVYDRLLTNIFKNYTIDKLNTWVSLL